MQSPIAYWDEVKGKWSDEPDKAQLAGNVFITGGCGFLGRGIIERAKKEHWNCRFTVFSRDAHKHAAMKHDYPDVRVVAGDVAADVNQLSLAMLGHDVVIHAAAYKYVDLSELNVWECIRSNIIGSMYVAQAAIQADVPHVVGISTDKACHSTNEYGGTKYQMEKAFQEADTWSTGTRFHLTRYGNVLAATGSIIKDWRRKYAEQGFIDATDPDMTRFWLSVDQAVDLILRALQAPSGTITIPMLPSLWMKQMEEYLLPPGTKVTYNGLRPGEKRHEELFTAEEAPFVECSNENDFRLWPVYRKPLGIYKGGYTSDNPVRSMTRDELLEIVGGPIE